MFHFILLGAGIVVVTQVSEQRSRLERITVTQGQIRHLADSYRMQYGRPPSQQQLNSIIDNVIKNEIFYREALKLGLDSDDEIVRRRLVQKYEFLQEDLAISTRPTEAELLDYYHRHSNRYIRSATATFSHVYFSPDVRGEEGARAGALTLAARLNLERAVRAENQGDRFPGPYEFSALSVEQVVRVFGERSFSEAVFEVEPGRWSAPSRSGFGWHSVYVSSRQPPRLTPFTEVRDEIEQHYLDVQRQEHNAKMLAKLRHNYLIVWE